MGGPLWSPAVGGTRATLADAVWGTVWPFPGRRLVDDVACLTPVALDW